MDLTLRQFRDRLNDIGEVEKMFNGGGKGRVSRNKKQWREFMRWAGKSIPRHLR